jgi:phosphate transport system permease protein
MAVACLPLVLILYVVVERGWAVVDLHFFTQDTLPFRLPGGGFRQGFVGSFLIMALATPLAIGLGVAAAVYLVEYGQGRKLAALVRFVTDVMTGVPSIFVGLFVYAVLVIGTVRIGFGTLAAAVAIAIVMLPIVVRSAEEMLKLVPDSLRNASLGLGARRWQTTTRVVLPAAAPGLATGSMLAVARGAGETAPLILTALGSYTMTVYLVGARQAALPQLIHQSATQPFPPGIARAWGGALCLVAITLLFTVVARIVAGRFASRREGM